jgi:N-succinyldiaminopimelate aminotransferase
MPRFPHRASSVASLSSRVFSALVEKAKARAAAGHVVHPLHVGDTYLEPYPGATAEAQRAEGQPRLHNYAPPQGEPALLEAIQARLEARGGSLFEASLLQVCSGATSGLDLVVQSFCEPGDEVLLPSPFWPLIRGIIKKRGAVPVEVPLWPALADDAGFDVEAALEARVTERTVALYLNTPHNPTGVLWTDAQLAAAARVADRHGLWVFSDEVYEEVYFGGLPPTPVWARPDFETRTVAVHSMSKGYGLAGSRVGWIHGPSDAMETLRGVQTFSTYCAPKPLQRGAARALQEGDAWLAESRRVYGAAALALSDALGIRPVGGGTFAFLDIRPHRREGEDTLGFLERCLEAGVLLTPGSASGEDYEGWVRICFSVVPLPELRDALDRLRPLFGR